MVVIVVSSDELVYLVHIIVPAGGEVSKEASNSLSNIPAYFLIVALPRPHEHLHASKHHSIVCMQSAAALSTLSRNARISPPKSHETA